MSKSTNVSHLVDTDVQQIGVLGVHLYRKSKILIMPIFCLFYLLACRTHKSAYVMRILYFFWKSN